MADLSQYLPDRTKWGVDLCDATIYQVITEMHRRFGERFALVYLNATTEQYNISSESPPDIVLDMLKFCVSELDKGAFTRLDFHDRFQVTANQEIADKGLPETIQRAVDGAAKEIHSTTFDCSKPQPPNR